MDDKELLELAAKAAGIKVVQWHYNGFEIDAPPPYDWKAWNPLDDDGDALRLAVKLHIYLDFNVDNVEADGAIKVKYETNRYAATRRAIVRTAAEIGKEMK